MPSYPFLSSLDILDTDYENYSVLYSCTDFYLFKVEFAWLLTRYQSLDPLIEDDIMESARETLALVDIDYDATFDMAI